MIYKFGLILHMISSKSSINDNKDLPIICHKHVKVYVGKCFKNPNQWLYVRIRCYKNWIENQCFIVYVWVKKEAVTWLLRLYKATQRETWDSSDIEVIFQGNI